MSTSVFLSLLIGLAIGLALSGYHFHRTKENVRCQGEAQGQKKVKELFQTYGTNIRRELICDYIVEDLILDAAQRLRRDLDTAIGTRTSQGDAPTNPQSQKSGFKNQTDSSDGEDLISLMQKFIKRLFEEYEDATRPNPLAGPIEGTAHSRTGLHRVVRFCIHALEPSTLVVVIGSGGFLNNIPKRISLNQEVPKSWNEFASWGAHLEVSQEILRQAWIELDRRMLARSFREAESSQWVLVSGTWRSYDSGNGILTLELIETDKRRLGSECTVTVPLDKTSFTRDNGVRLKTGDEFEAVVFGQPVSVGSSNPMKGMRVRALAVFDQA